MPTQRAELCRWLLKTDVRLLSCFSMDMQNNGFLDVMSKAETQAVLRGPATESAPVSGSAPGSDGDGSGGALPGHRPHAVCGGGPGTGAGIEAYGPRVRRRRWQLSSLTESPPPGPTSKKFTARILEDANLVMHVTQR